MELYKINKVIEDVLEHGFVFDEETGEVLFDEENLNDLMIAFNEKVDNIACYIKSLEGLNEAIANEKKALDARKKANDKKIERLKDYIKYNMMQREMDKLETGRNKISFRKSTSLNIINEDAIPMWFFEQKVEYKLNKTQLTKELKNGQIIEGCELVEKQNLQLK